MKKKLKFRHFFIMILLIQLFLQIGRMLDANNYFSVKQIHNFDKKSKIKNTDYRFSNPQKKLIYYSRNSEQSVKILENIEKIFKYNKIDYRAVNIDEVLPVDEYDTYIFATDNFLGFHKVIFDDMIAQVNQGKNLIFLSTTEFNPFNELAGIVDMKELKEDSAKIKFTKKFFPGLDEFSPSENLVKYATYDTTLKEDSKIILKSGDERPVLWEKNVGKGRILYTNASFFSNSRMIGLLNQWLAYSSDWYITPVLNTSVVQIEDFPTNVPDRQNAEIEEHYYVNQKNFIEKIWWEDIKSIGEHNGIIYTGALSLSPDLKAEKSKKVQKEIAKDLRTQTEKLVGSGGEIAIGASREDKKSPKNEIEELKKYTKKFFGNKTKIYTYISPDNSVADEEMKALKAGYPDLRMVSTKFYSDNGKIEEIGKNRTVPAVYNIPVFSTDFFYNADEMWKLYNGIATYGYWSHSIKSLETLKPHAKNEKDWEELKQDFQKIVSNVRKNFSFFRAARSYEMAQSYMNIEDVKIISEREGDKIKIGIKNYKDKFEVLIRIRYNKISKISDGTFREVYDTGDSRIYLVSLENQNTIIELGDK